MVGVTERHSVRSTPAVVATALIYLLDSSPLGLCLIEHFTIAGEGAASDILAWRYGGYVNARYLGVVNIVVVACCYGSKITV